MQACCCAVQCVRRGSRTVCARTTGYPRLHEQHQSRIFTGNYIHAYTCQHLTGLAERIEQALFVRHGSSTGQVRTPCTDGPLRPVTLITGTLVETLNTFHLSRCRSCLTWISASVARSTRTLPARCWRHSRWAWGLGAGARRAPGNACSLPMCPARSGVRPTACTPPAFICCDQLPHGTHGRSLPLSPFPAATNPPSRSATRSCATACCSARCLPAPWRRWTPGTWPRAASSRRTRGCRCAGPGFEWMRRLIPMALICDQC